MSTPASPTPPLELDKAKDAVVVPEGENFENKITIKDMMITAAGYSIVGGNVGASVAYYSGQKVLIGSGMYFMGTAVASLLYLSSGIIVKTTRKKDDFLNDTIAGSVAGAILSRGHNISRFTLFVVAGGTLGALNYIGGKWLYNFSRQTWLTSRRTMVENKRLFEATNPTGLITQQPKSTSSTFSK
jgi:hypothetical protein